MPENNEFKAQKGLNEEIIRQISQIKNEPEWMLNYRLDSYEKFKNRKLPEWGAELDQINFDEIYYYIKPNSDKVSSWEDLPNEIKETYDKIGVPKAERELLSGLKAQYDSEVVFGSLKNELSNKGVIFLDTDTALKKHENIFKKFFGTVISNSDNKFASLNSAVWSGGSFIYVPPNTQIDLPLSAYFRINAASFGQFERTLIIVDENSSLHYVEGCTAPIYKKDSLHSAVVEIVCMKNSKVRYTTIQNWSKNVYNLVTKRAFVYENARMEWIDGNLGSKVTMKYPSCILLGEHAHGEVMSLAYSTNNQHIDSGAKMIHVAKNTSSLIVSKSVCQDSGITSYRGLVKFGKNANNSRSNISCDALIFDNESETNTFPHIEDESLNSTITHEASVSKINEEQLFYLNSRGLSNEDSKAIITAGFLNPITRELPMEYAVELNRLINLNMEGSVG